MKALGFQLLESTVLSIRWLQIPTCAPTQRVPERQEARRRCRRANEARAQVPGWAVQAVGWLKVPRFNARNRSTKTPVSSAGFNYELAPLQRGRHGEGAELLRGDEEQEGRSAQPALIGRNYITDRDSAPVQCNDSIVHRWYWYTNILWLTIFDQSEPVAHPYRKEKWVKGTMKVSRSSTGEIVEDYEPRRNCRPRWLRGR